MSRAGISVVVVPTMARSLAGAAGELVLASLLVSLVALALPIALLHVYDRVLAQGGMATFVSLAVGVAVALCLEAMLRTLRSGIVARAGAAWEARAQIGSMARLTRTPVAGFERRGAGLYLERLASIGTVREAYSGAAFLALLDLPFCLLYVAIMAHLSPTLALVPVVLAALYLAASLAVSRMLRRTVAALADGEERRFNMLFDILANIHSVKALGLERQMLRRHERLAVRCAAARRGVTVLSARGHGAALFLASVGAAVIAALGAIEVIEGRLSIGGLGACLLLGGRALQPLSAALTVFTRAEVLRGASERLGEITAMPVPPAAPPLVAPRGGIVIENVLLRRDDGSAVLAGLSLTVPAGAIVAVTGRNGSGKTALLRLISGEADPSHGRVMIDGTDLSGVDPESIAEAVGYLPAQGALITGTLIENITMHRPWLVPRARALAAELGLDQVAAQLPQGFDTPVGETGTVLPRGVVQLVAIARALVAAPRIVLFDDADASLDADGDRRVRALLARLRGHCTIILVTSRPSTLALAQETHILAEGRLAPHQ